MLSAPAAIKSKDHGRLVILRSLPYIRQGAKDRGLQARQLAADQLMRGQRSVYIAFMNDSSSLFPYF